MQEQILRLEIPMHDVMFIQHAKSLNNLRKIRQCYLLRETSFFLEHFLKSTTVAVLIDKVKIIDSLEHIEVFDDMLAGLEIGQDVDLIEGALLQLRKLFELVSLDHLYGYLLLVLHVDCPVDGGVHPTTYLVLQRVILDHLPHY